MSSVFVLLATKRPQLMNHLYYDLSHRLDQQEGGLQTLTRAFMVDIMLEQSDGWIWVMYELGGGSSSSLSSTEFASSRLAMLAMNPWHVEEPIA